MTSINSKLTQLYTRGDDKNASRPLTEVELRRRVNLIMLIDDAGGQTPMAKKLGTANTSYLSQQVSANPHRVINEKGARKLEKILGLTHEWMDSPQTKITYGNKHEPVQTATIEIAPVQTKPVVQMAVDTARLGHCLFLVTPHLARLNKDKAAKIISMLYESPLSGEALNSLAENMIELSAH